jgi:hypothetical protein
VDIYVGFTTKQENFKPPAKSYIFSREKTPISKADQKKIAVIYGTSNLHTACDTNSFTRELHKVYEEEGGNIPILQIVR